MRYFSLCLIFCTALLLAPAKSGACWCPPQSEDKFYREAAAVFTAKIINNVEPAENGSRKMLARVITIYKGKPAEEVYLLGDDPLGCGANLKKGQKYLVYVQLGLKDTYAVSHCTGTYLLEGTRVLADIAVMEDRRLQVEALGDAIAQNPKQERLLLKAMAEHEVYWQDYANAEDSLRRLIQLQPGDSWAIIQLFNALFEQKKAQEIWDSYESLKRNIKDIGREEIAVATSFAALELNKDVGEWFEYRLKKAPLKGKDFSNRKFKSLSAQESSFESVNFSSSEFQHASWRKSNAIRGNFSRTVFKYAVFEDSNFYGANFSGARLVNISVKDTRFMEANFSSATLKKGRISGAELHQAKFKDADLTEVKIKNSSFRGADISGADFTGASFEGVDWTDVIYDCKTTGVPLPPKVCPSAP